MSMRTDWPVTTLGPVRRLQVLGASIPGAVVRERLMDAPFDAVWAIAGDLEGGVPRFEPAVASARIVWRQDDRLTLETASPMRRRSRFDVQLQRGWCLMQEQRRRYLVGMAAEPDPDDPRRTRFAHLEGVPRPVGRLLVPFVDLAVRNDLRGIERLARAAAGTPGA